MVGNVKVAIVTGSNKGIGYAIVKGLCERFDGAVYLTARSADRGNAAVDKLKELGLNPLFHQLDVDNQESVHVFRDYIKRKYGGLDLLVNNAAIAFNQDAKEPFYVQASETVKTNYFGLLRVCESFFPLLRKDARVVNVSSSAGHLARIPSEELRSKLSDPGLTIQKLSDLMNEFLEDAKNNTNESKGWGQNSYVVSKVGVTALTRIQQKNVDMENPEKNISINCVHPGYVDTDMTNHKGVLTIEQGATAPLFVALDAPNWKGEFVWSDSKIVDWLSPNPPPRIPPNN